MSGNPFKSGEELEAYKGIWTAQKERLPTTAWIFETGEFLILGQSDIKHAENSLPPNNLRRYEVEDDGNVIKTVSCLASKSTQRLLQHILLVSHYRVEIYRFKNGHFSVALQGSPCDLSEVKDLMFTVSDDGLNDGGYSEKMLSIGPTCAIAIEGDSKTPLVGVCFWKEASKTIQVTEFYDNVGHDKLESVLIQFNPMEAVVQEHPKYRQVKKILDRNRILATNCAAKKGNLLRIDSDINNVLKKNHIEGKQAMFKAFSILQQHLAADLTGATDMKGIEVINLDDYAHLNGQAVTGLNIFDTARQSMSLFKVLNKTRTTGGERLLRVWLRQPLTDKLKIEERLSIVEAFITDNASRKSIHDNFLRRIPDFQSLSVKLEEKKNSLQDLYKCYLGAKEIMKLSSTLSQMQCRLIENTFVTPLEKRLERLQKFIELVEATLDFTALADNVFAVKADFDDELLQLGNRKDEIRNEIETALSVVSKYVGLEQKSIKLEFTQQHGYTFRVTMKDEKMLRKKQSEIIFVDTNKSGVRFRDKKLDHLNKKFLEVNREFEEQQKHVLKEISEITCGYASIFSSAGSILSNLDVLVGFSVAAVLAPIPYVKPTIIDRCEGSLKLTEARHPCLELLDNMNYIPNDIEFTAEQRFCIITGPNLGGKSTFLRSVALNVLMAQVGSYVACSEATLFPVDRVLVRIGAGDFQLQGVSTFMAEMLEAAHIIRSATSHSLILIDELGRGTSTYDGLGLAWSISEHIASNICAPTMFATHFHEVTRLEEKLPKTVFNRYVDAVTTKDEFTLLYQVRKGSSNKSFGLEVARLAGFPQEVLDDAKSFLDRTEVASLRQDLSSDEVSSFLSTYSQLGNNERKRKLELIEELKSKMAKAK